LVSIRGDLAAGATCRSLIGGLGKEPRAGHRRAGLRAMALEALGQGVQIEPVHDVAETSQARASFAALKQIEGNEA
jgi:dihydropteroate synthase